MKSYFALILCCLCLSGFAQQPETKPWFTNTLMGVSFESPSEMQVLDIPMPPSLTLLKTYLYQHDDLMAIFMYAESSFDTYDKKVGLTNSISNMVNSMGGSDLKLDFTEPATAYDDLRCDGTFNMKGEEVKVTGYVYWNGAGNFFLLSAFGENADLQHRMIESIKLETP